MLSFADAPGNWFTTIGRLGGLAKKLRAYQLDALSNLTDVTVGQVAQLKNEADVQALVGDSYLSVLSSTAGSVSPLLQNVAQTYLNRLIFRDSPRVGQTLTSQNVTASLGELIRQMGVQGATVRRHVLGSSTTAFTGTGNAVLNVSTTRPLDGLPLEHLYAETLTAVCTQDSYLGGATAGNETVTVVGTGSEGDPFAFDWPLGSNCSATLQAIDGDVDDGSGNLLTNSGFERFTSNAPDNWEVMVGTAGTDLFEEDVIVYDPASGGKSLGVVSDGSSLVQIRQLFGSSTGTQGTLDAVAQYGFCVFLRRDGGAPLSQGTLIADLHDGTAVIDDEAGTPCSVSMDLTTLTTGFAAYTGAFRTPLALPSAVYLRLRFSVPADTGRAVYLDKASLGAMTQLYASGPFVSCHAGSTPFVAGDYATITLTNSRDGSGGLDTFQTLMARLFPQMIGQEIMLPSSSVPSVQDTMIY